MRLEKSVPWEEMLQLLRGSADDRVLKLVECLLSVNPDMQKRSLASLATLCRLSQADLIREITRARVQEGVLRMSKHMPKVLEDTAVDARSTTAICENCMGTGDVIHNDGLVTCPRCSGKGKIRKAGNTEARKLVFEAAGLTNKKGPAVNVNVGAIGEIPSVEHDMAQIDRVLDATPVKAAT